MKKKPDNSFRGKIKTIPEDFVVNEVIDFSPDGMGPHILIRVEKANCDTWRMIDELGRLLSIPSPEIGVAGQKDRHSISRQWLTIPSHALTEIPTRAICLSHDFINRQKCGFNKKKDISSIWKSLKLVSDTNRFSGSGTSEILDTGCLEECNGFRTVQSVLPSGKNWKSLLAVRHSSKLRAGHLAGNYFNIRVRNAGSCTKRVEEILKEFSKTGFPNYYGKQRFGRMMKNAHYGQKILQGSHNERNRFKKRMYVSALQSLLFNQWLDKRIDDGLLHRAISGDILRTRQYERGLPVYCDFSASENTEMDNVSVMRGEKDPTGPIFGFHMQEASSEEAGREQDILDDFKLSIEDFEIVSKMSPGTRRPARACLQDVFVSNEEEDLLLHFFLEKGAYATTLLSEIGLETEE